MQESKKAPRTKPGFISRFSACLVCVALVCMASLGYPNMAPIEFKSGAASPKKDQSSIRMESEQVIIRLGKLSYTVDAVFHFFNTGETTTQWVGFPKRGARSFVRFGTWVDGTKVDTSEERNAAMKKSITDRVVSSLYYYIFSHKTQSRVSEGGWLAQYVTFPGRTTTTVRTSYEGYYAEGTAEYILWTGSYWKDRIGQAVFIIDSTDVGGTKNVSVNFRDLGVAPGPERMGDSLLRIEMRQVKPPPQARLSIVVTR